MALVWRLVTTALLVLNSSRGELAAECPYYSVNRAQSLLAMNVTHADMLYGTIIENRSIEDILALCRSDKLTKAMKEVNKLVDECTTEDASPTLPVFNVGGFKEAVEYLCQPANLRVVEDNLACVRQNVGRLAECRTERMQEAADVGGSDKVANTCSQQRAHAYCSKKVLADECGKDVAAIKTKMAELITSPYCDCKQVVARREIGRCMSTFCMTINGKNKGEEQLYDGLLFGAEGLEKIHDVCKSTKDGRSYELVRRIEECAAKSCKWREYFYKFQIYHKPGIMDAAKYFCESQNFLYPAVECVRRNWMAFTECQRRGLQEEDEKLEQEEKEDIMNDYICRRRVVTSQCISDHFSVCEGDILDRLNDLWLTRAPRMCRTDCQPLGFGGTSAVTSSITMVTMLSLLTYIHTS